MVVLILKPDDLQFVVSSQNDNYMFVGKGKGENKILKEFVWTIIFKIFSPRYLVVRRTTRSEFLVVLIHFMVVEDTRILLPWKRMHFMPDLN